MKAKISATERAAEWDRAFGSGSKKEFKGPKQTEFYVQKKIAIYLKDHWPDVRFYSTLDGFDIGNQRAFVSSIQWFKPGVPDMFIFRCNKKYTFLAIEIKKEGQKTTGTDHLERQAEWLQYLASCGARAVFVVGYEAAIKEIKDYMKL